MGKLRLTHRSAHRAKHIKSDTAFNLDQVQTVRQGAEIPVSRRRTRSELEIALRHCRWAPFLRRKVLYGGEVLLRSGSGTAYVHSRWVTLTLSIHTCGDCTSCVIPPVKRSSYGAVTAIRLSEYVTDDDERFFCLVLFSCHEAIQLIRFLD